MVVVRVDAIREVFKMSKATHKTTSTLEYDVINLRTGRKLVFRRAVKFRGVAKPPPFQFTSEYA